jgi:uncharacterized membrane protein
MLLRVPWRLSLVALFCLPAVPHEVPAAVEVQVWLRPQAQRLDLLLRVPLRAIRDVAFPETAAGSLDTGRLLPGLPAAIKTNLLDALTVQTDGQTLPPFAVERIQFALPSDRSFESFEGALAHIHRAAPEEALRWDQIYLDVYAKAPIPSAKAKLVVASRLHHLATSVSTNLRLALPDGNTRAYHWTDDPGPVVLDPSWTQAAATFVKLGFRHILEGTDHILFVLCLIIPLRGFRQLVWVVTAFTIAHSLTLAAAAYGWTPGALWFSPLIESAIAASILFMALENICREPRFRWPLAFTFGLVHGFGFSFALSESMQFAGSHLLLSLLSFNAGVEIGQLAILAVAAPVLQRVHSRVVEIVLSALIAHTAWHWLGERLEKLRQFPLPEIDVVVVLRLLAVTALAGGAIYWLRDRLALGRVIPRPRTNK